ncbi:hypothetical protein SAMN05892877_111127 [Rhizobium subbaraonis]|uniref:Uncharacterized protein n=1 Tax=Rhizobium subbaraonis TaxID=908946 RepID=A0A285UP86_9HYPH|nr:DUF6030 family protein [Rhizobium subbaraonis]SOC43507.1 hypothetical protein SAMN05892877_111127 [Rhizobium subbaraonis]
MADKKKGRSGKILFALLTLGILSAIAATFLLANDHRNLNRALVHFGFEPIARQSENTQPRPLESRGGRIPRPQVEIPERLVSRIVPMETKFSRTVRRDPKELCTALQRTGFANSGWQEGLTGSGWYCTSFREFTADDDGDGPKTSAYLSIRGSNQERLTSFRIKLNLENEATRTALTDAAIAAVGVFFEEVRWNDAPEILDNLRALKEFDVVVLGSRIQLKREFGDTPRFNFIITPDRSRPKNTYLPPYFDREKWLPMPDPPMAAR